MEEENQEQESEWTRKRAMRKEKIRKWMRGGRRGEKGEQKGRGEDVEEEEFEKEKEILRKSYLRRRWRSMLKEEKRRRRQR